MPVSRGSVNHRISEDLIAFGKTLLQPSSCKKPDNQARKQAEIVVARHFGMENTIFFPYARTCFHAILKGLEIGSGSEVLMTPFNISPMVHIVNQLGYKPIFIDINLQDFGPDYNSLDEALARKPACFLLTYLFGYIPNAELIAKLCTRYDVPLIEDISQSIGASLTGKMLGSFGRAAIYSASLTKYVDGYNGGFVLTNDAVLASSLQNFADTLTPPSPKRLRGIVLKTTIWNIALSRHVFNAFTYPLLVMLRTISRNTFDKLLGPSIKVNLDAPLPAYYFEDITSLQLKTIIKKLSSLDSLIHQRRSYAEKLLTAFKNNIKSELAISLPSINHADLPTYWQFVVEVGNTRIAQHLLFQNGIETGITNLPDLAELSGIEFRNAKQLKAKFIFIPLHRHLHTSDYARFYKCLSGSIPEINKL